VPYELLPREALVRAEPALAQGAAKFTGGLRLPGDETGDCKLFTTGLAALAQAAGVDLRFNVNVSGLLEQGGTVSGAIVDGLPVQADAVVVALGSHSTPFLSKLLRIPVYPVKGFSITVPIIDEDKSPVSTVLDETYKVAVTRFDRRIRVGGMANVVGYDNSLDESKRKTLEFVVDDLFPGAGDLKEVSFWTGLRPMTPDGTPIIGPTPIKGLWLNTGHGTLGWTMACGSAQLLADLLSQRTPAIDASDLSITRILKNFSSPCPVPSTPASTRQH